MAAVRRTAVAHLVWGPLGTEPFAAFLDSYARHDAGTEHDLVVVYNGVDSASLPEYRRLAAAAAPQELVLDRPHMDLGAYREAARKLGHERICFVNSYCEILADRWLRLLECALDEPSAGAAGATGSWASPLSYGLFQLGLPSPYGAAMPGRRAARAAFDELFGRPGRSAPAHWLTTALRTFRHGRGTGRFPAVHLRTNGFLIDRERWLSLASAPSNTKWDTYRLESGRRSITAQLRAAGTPPVVVDAHGVARRPGDWHLADVLFQADQQDLLIADNVTRRYTGATAGQREVLSAFAWADAARPGGR